ncbi:MAG: DUF6787 family protein, partial [Bacteroidota bacterium]
MNKFKERWEITANWQLIYPLVGILILGYSAYILCNALLKEQPSWLIICVSIIAFYLGLKLTLILFKSLSKKWVLAHRWEMIRVFLVFAITGSSSMYIGRPITKLLGITKENLNPVLYWVLFIIIGLIFY